MILFNLLNKFAKNQTHVLFLSHFMGENILWRERKVQFEMSEFPKLVHKTFKVGVRLHLNSKMQLKSII